MANQALTLLGALNLALKQEMARDNTVICYGEDVGFEAGSSRSPRSPTNICCRSTTGR